MSIASPPRLLFFRGTPFLLRRSIVGNTSCLVCGDLRPRGSAAYTSISRIGPRKLVCPACIRRRLPDIRIDPRTKQPVID